MKTGSQSFCSPTFHANLEFLNRGRHFSFSRSWDKERLLTLKAQIQDGRNERNVFRVFTRSSYACGFRIYRIFLGYRIFVLCDAKTFLFMVFFNRFVSYLAKAWSSEKPLFFLGFLQWLAFVWVILRHQWMTFGQNPLFCALPLCCQQVRTRVFPLWLTSHIINLH